MNIIRRYWRIIFPIFFVVLIWIFSDMSGDNSNNKSLYWADIFGLSNAAMRTFAHFILFGALGFSISGFVKGLHSSIFPTISLTLYPIVLCVAYGAIDEVHQLTIVGRNGTIGDVFIDSLAGIIGTLIYIIIFCFWRRWRIYRQLKQISR